VEKERSAINCDAIALPLAITFSLMITRKQSCVTGKITPVTKAWCIHDGKGGADHLGGW
jgi:hypothetical protein